MSIETTRDKIIELGRYFSQRIGYDAFSYKQIANELHIKNSSIHHYFPAKDDLAIAIIEHDHQDFTDMTKAVAGTPAAKQLEVFISLYFDYLCNNARLCVISTFGTTFNDVSDRIKTVSVSYSSFVIQWLTGVFKQGLESGEFTFAETPEVMAGIWMAALPGSLIVGRMQGVEYFTQIINGLKNLLIRN